MEYLAKIIIEKSDSLLLLKRSHKDSLAGFYELAGGKLTGNESIEETAKRELKEETGISIINLPLILTAEKHFDGRDFLIYLYYIKVKNSQNITLSNEHDEYVWENLKNIQDSYSTKMPPIQLELINSYSEYLGKELLNKSYR